MNDLIGHAGLTMADAVKRRNRLAAWFSWGLVAGVGLVAAPMAFTLLTAALALVAAAALAVAAVALAPVLAMKLANWRMAEILAEARRNPIPTLENELLVRKAALARARQQLTDSLAQVEGFVTQAGEAARRYPDMAVRWQERGLKAQALAQARSRSYRQACQAVDEFERVVERCRTEWKLVVAESVLQRSLASSQGEAMAELRSRTAIEAVTDQMNAAFASLEIALLEAAEATSPTNGPVDGSRIDHLQVRTWSGH